MSRVISEFLPRYDGAPAVCQYGVDSRHYKDSSEVCSSCKVTCRWIQVKKLAAQNIRLNFNNPHCVIVECDFMDTFLKGYSEHLTRKLLSVAYYPTPATTGEGVIPAGSWSVEMYQGMNYIVNSSLHSYSRQWNNGQNLPFKYAAMAGILLGAAQDAVARLADPDARVHAFLNKLQVKQYE